MEASVILRPALLSSVVAAVIALAGFALTSLDRLGDSLGSRQPEVVATGPSLSRAVAELPAATLSTGGRGELWLIASSDCVQCEELRRVLAQHAAATGFTARVITVARPGGVGRAESRQVLAASYAGADEIPFNVPHARLAQALSAEGRQLRVPMVLLSPEAALDPVWREAVQD